MSNTDTGSAVFVSRLVRLPLVDADDGLVGRVQDVVLVPSGAKLRVLGFICLLQGRRIFVNIARISEIDANGIHLRGGTINTRSFHQRPGEQLAVGDLFDTKIGDESLTDLGIEPSPDRAFWFVTQAALGKRGPLRRRPPRVTAFSELSRHFAFTPEMTEVADLLEEMPDEEAAALIETLDLERAAHILEEMEPDDAVDLLADLTEADRTALLGEMRPEESTPLRRLLAYDENTAGGLMTPEPVILAHHVTVAEALAEIREQQMPAELAAQVFVTQPPTSTPTGRYLGVVGFQRLLREQPSVTLESCVDTTLEPVAPDLPLREVAERLASYDLLALPVCDPAGRLMGAVTVDDVLDHVLPVGWRHRAGRP